MRETHWHDRKIEFREGGRIKFVISTKQAESQLPLSERKRFYEMARKWCSGDAGQVEILEAEAFGRL